MNSPDRAIDTLWANLGLMRRAYTARPIPDEDRRNMQHATCQLRRETGVARKPDMAQ
jgi:hypothetical protein